MSSYTDRSSGHGSAYLDCSKGSIRSTVEEMMSRRPEVFGESVPVTYCTIGDNFSVHEVKSDPKIAKLHSTSSNKQIKYKLRIDGHGQFWTSKKLRETVSMNGNGNGSFVPSNGSCSESLLSGSGTPMMRDDIITGEKAFGRLFIKDSQPDGATIHGKLYFGNRNGPEVVSAEAKMKLRLFADFVDDDNNESFDLEI